MSGVGRSWGNEMEKLRKRDWKRRERGRGKGRGQGGTKKLEGQWRVATVEEAPVAAVPTLPTR